MYIKYLIVRAIFTYLTSESIEGFKRYFISTTSYDNMYFYFTNFGRTFELVWLFLINQKNVVRL
jgi:hypothetical protein